MTKEQIEFIRNVANEYDEEAQKTRAYGFVLSLTDGTLYDSNKSFIGFNDDKELVVCIRSNFDHYRQPVAPVEIDIVDYNNVAHFDSYYAKDKVIEAAEALIGPLSDLRKEALQKWMDSMQISNLAPMEDRPYYKNEPKIQDGYHPPRARKDLKEGDTVYDQGGFDNI
jgi:hypothetical protein